MKSVSTRSTKPERKVPAPRQQQSNKPTVQKTHAPALSPCDDLQVLIAKRAYELYCERGQSDGSALDDWLTAEREILSQFQPASHSQDGHA